MDDFKLFVRFSEDVREWIKAQLNRFPEVYDREPGTDLVEISDKEFVRLLVESRMNDIHLEFCAGFASGRKEALHIQWRAEVTLLWEPTEKALMQAGVPAESLSKILQSLRNPYVFTPGVPPQNARRFRIRCPKKISSGRERKP